MQSGDNGRRLFRFDVGWCTTRTVRVVGPLSSLDAEPIRKVLRQLSDMHCEHPTLSLLDAFEGRYYPVAPEDIPEYIDILVSNNSSLSRGTLDQWAAQLLSPNPYPLQIVVGQDYLALAASHALGDGRSMNALLAALLADNADFSGISGATRTSRVLALAGAKYLRRPLALMEAVRQRNESAVRNISGAPHNNIEPGKRSMHVLHQRVDGRQFQDLRKWRDRNRSSASMAALAITLWFSALAQNTSDVPDGFWLIVDTRRYGGPSFAGAWGNYAQSVPLRPRSLVEAEEVGAAINRVLNSTWPLALLVAGGIRHKGAGGVRDQPQLSSGSINYYMSYMADPGTVGQWHWAYSQDMSTYISAATPAGPGSVTVQYREVAGTLHVTVTCEDDRLVGHLTDALELLRSPLDLLRS